MNQVASKWLLAKVKGYVKENWGSPFIVAFIVLLVTAALSLASGHPANYAEGSFADSLGTAAFFVLAVGVVLQIICNSTIKAGTQK
jgi:hypothetical protein